jgi:hypothetical protein
MSYRNVLETLIEILPELKSIIVSGTFSAVILSIPAQDARYVGRSQACMNHAEETISDRSRDMDPTNKVSCSTDTI